MIKKLKNRFIRIAMLAVTGVLLLLVISVNTANLISVDRELKSTLKTISDNQGSVPRPAKGDMPKNPMDGEKPYSTRYFVLRYNDDGILIKADLDHIASVSEDNLDLFLSYAQKHGEGYGSFSVYRCLIVSNGSGRNMAIFLDSYRQRQSVVNFGILSLCATAGCILLVYIIVVLCSRRAIDPLIKASERQKQFITDAGHELKTPITVIATCLKVLEMENGKQKWIDKAQAQTEKLTSLVNSLVALSKADEDAPVNFMPFDISAAAGETANSFSDFAGKNGRNLIINIQPEITYNGNEYAVRQLCSVLLDNAVKYAPENTDIVFLLEKSRKGVTISCENVAENVDGIEFSKLFDRFYRGDKARTSGGFGIGLSLARSIAEIHKGSIKAIKSDKDKIKFIAELK